MKIKTGSLVWEISFPLAAVMTAVILYDSNMSVSICFLSVLIHEAGHLAVMRFFGISPERIRLTLFDFAIVDRSKTSISSGRETAVILAGICANLLTAAAAMPWSGETAEKIVSTNLTLAAFNGLPIGNLDGGQALSLILCRLMSIDRAIYVSRIISVIFLVPLTALGFIVLFRTGYNFSILLTALYLAAMLYMGKG